MKDPELALNLIVTDASPLITLAAAESLDLLTLPKIKILIPDMVYFETTRDAAKLGARPIVQWTKDNADLVRIATTDVFAEYLALMTLDPKTPSRGRGELAANEVLTDAVAKDPNLEAILLYEDSDITRRKFAALLPERIMTVNTGAYLYSLQEAGRIQSADIIIEAAIAKGRDVSKQRVAQTTPEIADAIKKLVSNTSGRGF
jgi:hypothetical protein